MTKWFQLDEKELLLNQHKKDQMSKTRKLKAHLTQQETVNNELATKLMQQEAEKVTKQNWKVWVILSIHKCWPLNPGAYSYC